MEQRPSLAANRSSPGQEIPLILRNPKVYYRFCKYLPPVPILSQISPVYNFPFHLLNIHFNIIYPSRA
jgi:hypothetical protein